MSTETAYFKSEKKYQNREHIIAVEGNDDAILISNLLEKIKANPEKIGIIDVGGNSNFQSFLSSFFLSPGYTSRQNKSLSIICDADNNLAGRVDEINLALSAKRQPKLEVGHIIESEKIKLGLFVFPDGKNSGDLEKLCLDTVSEHEIHIEASRFIDHAEKYAGGALSGSRFKRVAQVYLAGMKASLSRGAGHGFRDGYFNDSHEALQPLLKFLRQIADLAS